MAKTMAEKIIDTHLVSKDAEGGEIGIHIDQTLTQDATGTMAYLEYEAMGIPRIQTELSVAYVDHNTLQNGFMNADDHTYLRTVAKRIGVRYSQPGNGICHQVHLERFAIPGKTLIGSDSHTPTAGGMGMLAIGAGGLDVAVAMGGGAYYIPMPKVIGVKLTGALCPYVSAKDVILEVLRRLTVKGGVGKIIEYTGEGVKNLTVPQRATITNMGAELGATTSIFPSDEQTRAFLAAEGREGDYAPLCADEGAVYSEIVEVNLSALQPLAACPHSPDHVKPVKELGLVKIDQVLIGSCTNSSYTDLMTVAAMLKGKTVHPEVSLAIAPGSKQVLTMLAENGALATLIESGARILESACGPCIGMGQSPGTKGVSLRTFNRNFEGRSGTQNASVYLVSPETAAASCLTGYFTDPTCLPPLAKPVLMPAHFHVNDNRIDLPAPEAEYREVEVLRGPNIKPIPTAEQLPEELEVPISLKVGDNITTDHIMPAGADILPYRSNLPHLSTFCFVRCDAAFPARAAALRRSAIVGGENYGQGSSREHAALAPLYLGVRCVVAKSFARIHKANLVNAGILPLEFEEAADYEAFKEGDTLMLPDLWNALSEGRVNAEIKNTGKKVPLKCTLSARQIASMRAGGLLNYTKQRTDRAKGEN